MAEPSFEESKRLGEAFVKEYNRVHGSSYSFVGVAPDTTTDWDWHFISDDEELFVQHTWSMASHEKNPPGGPFAEDAAKALGDFHLGKSDATGAIRIIEAQHRLEAALGNKMMYSPVERKKMTVVVTPQTFSFRDSDRPSLKTAAEKFTGEFGEVWVVQDGAEGIECWRPAID